MRTRVCCMAMALWLATAPVAAQVALSEAEALARLSADGPRARAIRAAIDISRADVLAASRWPNPRLTYDRESVAGITENMTMVLQPLPITGRRGFEKQAASALLDATIQRAGDELRRARADLRLTFAALQAAQTRERELALARNHLQEFAGILQKREAAGDAAGFDRLRAEREVLDIDADRVNAAVERGKAQASLAGFFSGPIDPSTVIAADAIAPRPPLPSVDDLFNRALTVRGEVLALDREMEAARFQERAAGRRLIPEPEVLAGTKSSTASGGDLGGVLALQASIPIFDRARAERALARARAAQAQARADALRVILRSEIAGLRSAVQERRAVAERYRASAVTSADQIEHIAQVSYDAGERGILEMLDAYRTTASARVRVATLDAAVREAEIELEFVSGWEIP